MAPCDHTRLVDEEIFGSEFSAQLGMVFLERDDDSGAVRTVAADGGHASNAVHEDGVGSRDPSRVEGRGVVNEAEVFFRAWDGVQTG